MPARGKFFGLKFLSPRRWPTCPPKPRRRRDGLLRGGVILIFLSWFALRPTPCYGVNLRDIVINEVMYDLAGTDEDHEWIEIFNNSTASAQLVTWRFEEGGTQHQLTLKQGDWPLLAGDYAVIADNADQFLNDNPGFSGTLLDSSFSLSNDGENLKLRDEYNGTVIDDLFYSSGWGGGEGYSLERKSPGGDSNDSDNWQSGSYGGSPGAVNVLPVPTPTPTPTPTQTSAPTPTLTSTLTSTPTPQLAPTNTPTTTKKLTPTPTLFGEILGATEAGEATFSSHLEEGKDEEKELEEKGEGSPFLWPKVLIGLGLALIIGASYPLWLPKLKMLYNIKEIIRGNAAKPRLTRRSE